MRRVHSGAAAWTLAKASISRAWFLLSVRWPAETTTLLVPLERMVEAGTQLGITARRLRTAGTCRASEATSSGVSAVRASRCR